MPYLEFNKLMTQTYMLAEYGEDRAAAVKFLRDAIAEDDIRGLAEEWRTRFDDPDMRGSKFQNVMHGILVEVLGGRASNDSSPQTGDAQSAQQVA